MLHRIVCFWLIAVALAGGFLSASSVKAGPEEFGSWLIGLRDEAIASGVTTETFDAAFAGATRLTRVIELDRRQPEFMQSFWRYLDARVTASRVNRGQAMLADYAPLLASVQQFYVVQPRFLVAFWGMETSYGGDTGDFPLISALATLAYDGRRSDFFRQQLMAALQLIERGDIPYGARGSWAGAVGQMQFMPTTYRDYAVDFDGDGRRDLWNSLPDIFASAANYLASIGWNGEMTWGREVVLPNGFEYALSGPDKAAPLHEWQALGVRASDGSDLPAVDAQAALILPGGAFGGPAFLVYRNFRAIMTWNNSMNYAIAVGHLADRIAGGEPLRSLRVEAGNPMSREQVIEMQALLEQLGFDTGGIDGRVGAKTREAVRSAQQLAQLPADGYPTPSLLDYLRAVTRNG